MALNKKEEKQIKIFIPENLSLKIYKQQICIKESSNWKNYGLDFPESLIYVFPDYIELKLFPSLLNYTHLILSLKKEYLNKIKLYKTNAPLHAKLFKNKIKGFFSKYVRFLIINGIGYKFELENNKLCKIYAGFSVPIILTIPDKIEAKLESSTILKLSSTDNYILGKFANDIRSTKPIESYKAKGIHYKDSIVKIKSYKKIR